METNHFSLRLSSVTAGLPIPMNQLRSAVIAAQETFEELRRQGVPVQQAVEKAESVLFEDITPTLDAASRLKDILANEFENCPELVHPPYFTALFQKLMPLLVEPQSRLADAYIVGLITEYTQKHLSNGL